MSRSYSDEFFLSSSFLSISKSIKHLNGVEISGVKSVWVDGGPSTPRKGMLSVSCLLLKSNTPSDPSLLLPLPLSHRPKVLQVLWPMLLPSSLCPGGNLPITPTMCCRRSYEARPVCNTAPIPALLPSCTRFSSTDTHMQTQFDTYKNLNPLRYYYSHIHTNICFHALAIDHGQFTIRFSLYRTTTIIIHCLLYTF